MPKVRTLTEKQRREQREQPASCGNDPSLCAARPEERARDEGQPGRVLRLCRDMWQAAVIGVTWLDRREGRAR